MKNSKLGNLCARIAPAVARACGIVSDEEREAARKEAKEHWQQVEDAAAAKDRTHNICMLAAGILPAMSIAGLWSMAAPDQAVELAEAILDRIESGPAKEGGDDEQG